VDTLFQTFHFGDHPSSMPTAQQLPIPETIKQYIEQTVENEQQLFYACVYLWGQQHQMQLPNTQVHISKLQQLYLYWNQLLEQPIYYKQFYIFVFTYFRGQQSTNRRTLDVQLTRYLLYTFLDPLFPAHCCSLLQYLLEKQHTIQRITFDVWRAIFEWCSTICANTLYGYSADAAWPSLLDEVNIVYNCIET
jgi:hypothetical protein